MKKSICNILLFVFIIVSFNANAQDIHFSKFLSAPLILNPANTTNYHGNWSFISNYRKQGINSDDPYITATAAVDFPVYFKNERAGFGLIWINDNSALNTLKVNKIYLSSAYFIKISQKSYLHLGLQAGYVLKKLDYSDLTFPDQFDISNGYFNSDLNSADMAVNHSVSYLDLNWGLIWSLKKEKFTSEIGVAMFHYNMPVESFYNNDDRLKPKYTCHAFIEKILVRNMFVKPKILYVNQNKASELLLGFNTGVLFPQNRVSKQVYLGGFFRGGFNRNPDAIIFNTGFNYKSFDISLSYDIEISRKNLFIYPNNSFEISIIFKRAETNLENKTIPCTVF